MRKMSITQFRRHMDRAVTDVLRDAEPLRVTRRGGGDFVVLSAADWESERETLYVLQNQSLMQQLAVSLATYAARAGHRSAAAELVAGPESPCESAGESRIPGSR